LSERFTRLWARLLVVIGMVIVVLGVLLAIVALIIETPWGSVTGQAVAERALVAVFLVVSGILAGAPFIVFGQLLLIFLDQRRLLAAIHRRLRRRSPRPS
jgi:ABC-type phosphate transport system permease subunit